MKNQQRVTVVMKRADDKTIHLRKATRAESHQEAIYLALGIPVMKPGSVQKIIVRLLRTDSKIKHVEPTNV